MKEQDIKNILISKFKVAVILPCYNEEVAIHKTVTDFKQQLPESVIYVFDNNSTDHTAEYARTAGAIVVHVSKKGKCNVVRRMFADINADIYLMADGDATYDADSASNLIKKLIDESLDMVVGCRADQGENENYRRGHRLGNRMLTSSVRMIFGGEFTDMLSGYRAFSRRYVKSFPNLSTGFEIETELTIHALELRMPYGELVTPYNARLEGSFSELSTYRDGIRILKTIGRLYRVERPLQFFSIIGFIFAFASILISLPILQEYLVTGLVPRLPTAVLSVGLMLSAQLAIVCGIVLDNVTRGRQELRRIAYLGVQGVPVLEDYNTL